MNYIYRCLTCEAQLRESGQDLATLTTDQLEELLLFETSHAMCPTPEELQEALVCPRCQTNNCVRSYHGMNIIAYVRGNGFLDRAGCYRDMHLHHLTQHDPYAQMRQPGEVDELKAKIKRAGQHAPNPKHFMAGSDLRKEVSEATSKPSSD